MPWTVYRSPLGPLTLIAGDCGLRRVCLPGRSPRLALADEDPAPLGDAVEQLAQYFAGGRSAFELELDLVGSAFQRGIWTALRDVPYGSTTSYGELARALGVADTAKGPSAAQKVGWAVAATPAPIVVPCHRVLAADGSLAGYLGGLQRKQALLDFEASGGAPEALRPREPRQLSLL